jgi:hypothetical protein
MVGLNSPFSHSSKCSGLTGTFFATCSIVMLLFLLAHTSRSEFTGASADLTISPPSVCKMGYSSEQYHKNILQHKKVWDCVL